MIVSSYENAAAAFEKYRPGHVVSILSADDGSVCAFPELPADRRIELRGDCSVTDENSEHCAALIQLAKSWDRTDPILIHCKEGVARSMAAAYIVLCAAQDRCCEQQIAKDLRAAAPHADPNMLLVSEADAMLGRDDRMVEAILDLSPCAGSVCSDVVVLPVTG